LLVVCRQPKSKSQRENPITKARNLEITKKGLSFYTTPSSFVPSSLAKLKASKFRVFVVKDFSSFSLYVLTMRPPTTDG
jgi:hypothetical protein